MALDITTGKQVVEDGGGSARVGELRAVVLAAQNGGKAIYMDSCCLGRCDTVAMSMGNPKMGSKQIPSLEKQRLAVVARHSQENTF